METQSGKISAVMVQHFSNADVCKNFETLPTRGIMQQYSD